MCGPDEPMLLRKRKHQGSDTMQSPNSPHLALLARPSSLPPTMPAAHASCAPPAESTSPAVLLLRAPPCVGNAGIRAQTPLQLLTRPTPPSSQHSARCHRPCPQPTLFASPRHREAQHLLCCHYAHHCSQKTQASGFKTPLQPLIRPTSPSPQHPARCRRPYPRPEQFAPRCHCRNVG
jgi:hypothetical protein